MMRMIMLRAHLIRRTYNIGHMGRLGHHRLICVKLGRTMQAQRRCLCATAHGHRWMVKQVIGGAPMAAARHSSARARERADARAPATAAAALVSWPPAPATNGGPGVPSSLRSFPVDDLSGLPPHPTATRDVFHGRRRRRLRLLNPILTPPPPTHTHITSFKESITHTPA